MKLAMAPTSEEKHTMHPEDPYDIYMSTKVLDNSCETYFYFNNSSPPLRSAIPEASPVFRRALGTMEENKSNTDIYQSESDDEDGDYQQINPQVTQRPASSSKRNTSVSSTWSSTSSSSSASSSSHSSSPSISPRTSPKHSRSSPKPISTSQSIRKTASPKNSNKFLSVPSSSLPTDSSAPDSSDSGAHTTLAGVALRKGCTRKAASFGGYDTVKVDRNRYEKRVSWADERGSKHQLIHVRLIRPRLAPSTSDGTMSTPGQSILKTHES